MHRRREGGKGGTNWQKEGAMRQTRNSEHPPPAPIDGDVWLSLSLSLSLSGGRMKIWRHMDQIEGKMRRRRRRRYYSCLLNSIHGCQRGEGGGDSCHIGIHVTVQPCSINSSFTLTGQCQSYSIVWPRYHCPNLNGAFSSCS